MPSRDIFESQPKEYREGVPLPHLKAWMPIEQASTFGWDQYVGTGRVIRRAYLPGLGALKELQNKFGFESDQVVAAATEQLA